VEKAIRRLKDHYIICGTAGWGRSSPRSSGRRVQFVVVEKKAIHQEEGVLILREMPPGMSLFMKRAWIGLGLISVLPTDAENLFVVLSARGSTRSFSSSPGQSKRGGAETPAGGGDQGCVPLPYRGLRMAHTVLKPTVVDFLEFATKSGTSSFRWRRFRFRKSPAHRLTLEECGIGRTWGHHRGHSAGHRRHPFNPTFRSTVKAGDTLIALGRSPSCRESKRWPREKLSEYHNRENGMVKKSRIEDVAVTKYLQTCDIPWRVSRSSLSPW